MEQVVTELEGLVLDERLTVTVTELTYLCRLDEPMVYLMVSEGVVHPSGSRPEEWRFSGVEILRARRALRLQRDLEINLAGVALALDLLEEVEALRARLHTLEFLARASDPPLTAP
ncbi:MAG: chaperone modulator CbpM [Candidatus Latescibacterota bacterium]|jgi:chaperone modulatory protein CbpM